MIELERCPVCAGQDVRGFDLGAGNVLRRCEACETVSAPAYADPKEIYVDGYMFGQAPGDFGLDVRDPAFQELLVRIAHRRLDFIERATGVRQGSLLDVGSGTGEVLAAARDRGWTTQGVEPERTAAEMARGRGLGVKISTLEESGLPEASYDVVSAFHVLEHIPESRGFLRTLERWARPGGFVTIEVPNFKGTLRRRRRHGWSGLRPLEHIVHFEPDTLRRAFRLARIEPIYLRSPVYVGPPQNLDFALADLARQGGFRRLVEPLSPRRRVDGGQARYPSRLGWAVLRTAEAIHDRAGVGSVVFCVGRVPDAQRA